MVELVAPKAGIIVESHLEKISINTFVASVEKS